MTLQSRKSQTNRDVLVSVSVVWKVVRLLCWGHRVTHACLPPFLCWRGSQESQPRALGGTRTYSLDLSFPSPALWPVHPQSQTSPPTWPPRGALTTARQPAVRPARGPSISAEKANSRPRCQGYRPRKEETNSALGPLGRRHLLHSLAAPSHVLGWKKACRRPGVQGFGGICLGNRVRANLPSK